MSVTDGGVPWYGHEARTFTKRSRHNTVRVCKDDIYHRGDIGEVNGNAVGKDIIEGGVEDGAGRVGGSKGNSRLQEIGQVGMGAKKMKGGMGM